MSKFGSIKYHIGNIVITFGIALLLVNLIITAYTLSGAPPISFILLVSSGFGVIAGIVFTILGSIILIIDKEKSGRGIIIGDKEKHEISIKSKGNKVILYVDKQPSLEFETKYLKKDSISTTIGDKEKHTVKIEAKASAWTGEIDKFVYVDNQLVLKDERPVW